MILYAYIYITLFTIDTMKHDVIIKNKKSKMLFFPFYHLENYEIGTKLVNKKLYTNNIDLLFTKYKTKRKKVVNIDKFKKMNNIHILLKSYVIQEYHKVKMQQKPKK